MCTHLLDIRPTLPIVREDTQNEMTRRLLAFVVAGPVKLQFLVLKTILSSCEGIRTKTHTPVSV